jgi:hypothetical protein
MSSIEGVGGELALPTADERTMSMLAHAGGIFFSFVPALVIYLTKGTESAFIKDQAKEALNFQITVAIAWAVTFVLMFLLIGLLIAPILYVVAVVFSIIGAIAANNGQPYRYPITLRLVQ